MGGRRNQFGMTREIGIKSISFEDCKSLENVHIPQGVTHIGAHAFSGCCGIKDIVIPPSVRTIEKRTFSDTHLSRVRRPEGVEVIGRNDYNRKMSIPS